MRGTVTAVVSAAALITTVALAPSAAAADRWSLNGTYTATSNGEWARTNDVFRNEVSLRSIWTISSQCSYPGECTGTVNSDLGWTAPIYQTGGTWYVKHVVPNWITCPDGVTTVSGFQVFRFMGTTPDGASAVLVDWVAKRPRDEISPHSSASATRRCLSSSAAAWAAAAWAAAWAADWARLAARPPASAAASSSSSSSSSSGESSESSSESSGSRPPPLR